MPAIKYMKTAIVSKMSFPKLGMLKRMYHRSISETEASEQDKTGTKITKSRSLREPTTPTLNKNDNMFAFEELCQCGICFDRLLDPRMLPCQHTFCLSCLQGHLSAITGRMMKKKHSPPSTDEIKEIVDKVTIPLPCPTCQIPININKGSETLQQLPRNVYIDSLLTLIEDKSSSSIADSPSSPNMRCIKCQTVCELPGKSCGHCNQIFCNICWTEHVSTLKSNLSTLIEHLHESEVRLKHRINDFNNHCDKVCDNIDKTTKDRIIEIKEREKNAIAQLHNIKKSEENVAKELQNRINKVSEQITELKFEDITSDDQKVNTFMNFHRVTSKIVENVSRWGEIKILFDAKLYKVTQSNQFTSTESTDDDVNFANAASNVNPFESIDSMSTYYLGKSFRTKLVWTKCPRPTGLGIPPWAPHLLYIATTDRKVVLIMDRNESKVIGKLVTPDMLHPQAIAFCSKRMEVYISDKWKHCIHVFNHEGDYLRTLSNLGSGAGEVRSPDGIAINNRNELVVCDAGNDRVLILNPDDGDQISVLGMVGNRTQFQTPTGVTVYEDRIIIADNGNHSIKVFTTAGQKILEFGTVGTIKGQFRNAEVVACDPMGFIFVGDSGNARIQIFNPNGELVRVFGKFGETTGKFAWVSGLVVTPQLEIITTDYKNRCLQIF